MGKSGLNRKIRFPDPVNPASTSAIVPIVASVYHCFSFCFFFSLSLFLSFRSWSIARGKMLFFRWILVLVFGRTSRSALEGWKWRKARWSIDRSSSFFNPFDFEWMESRRLIKVSATMVEVSLHSPLVRIVLTEEREGREGDIDPTVGIRFCGIFFPIPIFNSRGVVVGGVGIIRRRIMKITWGTVFFLIN